MQECRWRRRARLARPEALARPSLDVHRPRCHAVWPGCAAELLLRAAASQCRFSPRSWCPPPAVPQAGQGDPAGAEAVGVPPCPAGPQNTGHADEHPCSISSVRCSCSSAAERGGRAVPAAVCRAHDMLVRLALRAPVLCRWNGSRRGSGGWRTARSYSRIGARRL
eukprot:509054-Prymnesium_polylepis.1